MRALLLLTALTSPSVAHNGAVAIAVPVEGIVVDGQFDDWPEEVQRWPVVRTGAGDRPVDHVHAASPSFFSRRRPATSRPIQGGCDGFQYLPFA